MKLRAFFLLALSALLLAACSFASDVTPPPNYVPPTPLPTLGPLYPAQPMDIANGEKIYAAKCAACHGKTGLGDGEQGKQLPVKVAAIGLPAVAQKAKPADWYMQVTRGNIEKFMPPFASLNDQERWDVVGYALTLHTANAQLEQGKKLFDENCADCGEAFSNLEVMSGLSELDLMAMIQTGNGAMPAIAPNLSDEEAAAFAAYLRSQTFAAPLADAPATQVPAAESTPEANAAPVAESTPVEGGAPQALESTATAAPVEGVGNVFGQVDNQTGAALPADATVILHGFEHGGDPNAAPQEVVNLTAPLNADGTYQFENVDIPASRVFVAEVSANGLSYQSDFAFVAAGAAELEMPAVILYASTDDFSVLKMPAAQMFFDYPADGSGVQMFVVYSLVNDSGKMVSVKMSADQKEIPFLATAQGAQQLGFEAAQDSASFIGTGDGFAMPPSATPYSLISFSQFPAGKKIQVSQPFKFAVDKVTLFLPEGVTAKGAGLSDDGVKDMQGTKLHLYSASVAKDSTLEFTLSGNPKAAASNSDLAQNQNLLIGVGAFGAVLIAIGAWLYLRDRRQAPNEDGDEEDEDDEDEEGAEEVLDAILALDDLHRAGKLSDEAYQQRRAELKSKLKHD
ncbi:MAG: hypothetical protein Fur002_13500 [Anaerolineales bacterium]